MAKYIDADTMVGLRFFDDTRKRKTTIEVNTIENILDNFTVEGCPEPADVVPYSIEPDGTLIVVVPKGTKRIGRILIEEDGTQYCGLFYPDTGGCFLSSMEKE